MTTIQDPAGPGQGRTFGEAVAVVNGMIVVGAPSQQGGVIFVFNPSGQLQQTITSPGPGGGRFGHSLAPFGNDILIGSLDENNQDGFAHLRPLSVDETVALLRNTAHVNQRHDVARFLETTAGFARVRALHHLSGGSHRIVVVLSRFITRGSIDDLVGPFRRMVDELTPYYQERIRALPPQQRKIVEYLCAAEAPAPVKDITRQLFTSGQSISSQLKHLRGKGYVISSARGRDSLYQIAEPLMRICFEVKESRNQEPLRLLVDFLRAWHNARDLARQIEQGDLSSEARSYVRIALEAYATDGDPRDRPATSLPAPAWTDPSQADPAQVVARTQPPSDEQVVAEKEPRDVKTRIGRLSRKIRGKGNSDRELAQALNDRGVAYGQSGDTEAEIRDYSRVVELDGAPVEPVARALFCRGLTYGKSGNIEASMRDLEALRTADGARIEEIVDGSRALARLHMVAGGWSDGIDVLDSGLRRGRAASPRYLGAADDLVGVIFELALDPRVRREREAEVVDVFCRHDGASTLGQGLIGHLGVLYRGKGELPDPTRLERWSQAWRDATQGLEEYRLPMRIFRTGIAFLQSGGKDLELLFGLRIEERAILEQALGLDDAEEARGEA